MVRLELIFNPVSEGSIWQKLRIGCRISTMYLAIPFYVAGNGWSSVQFAEWWSDFDEANLESGRRWYWRLWSAYSLTPRFPSFWRFLGSSIHGNSTSLLSSLQWPLFDANSNTKVPINTLDEDINRFHKQQDELRPQTEYFLQITVDSSGAATYHPV